MGESGVVVRWEAWVLVCVFVVVLMITLPDLFRDVPRQITRRHPAVAAGFIINSLMLVLVIRLGLAP